MPLDPTELIVRLMKHRISVDRKEDERLKEVDDLAWRLAQRKDRRITDDDKRNPQGRGWRVMRLYRGLASEIMRRREGDSGKEGQHTPWSQFSDWVCGAHEPHEEPITPLDLQCYAAWLLQGDRSVGYGERERKASLAVSRLREKGLFAAWQSQLCVLFPDEAGNMGLVDSSVGSRSAGRYNPIRTTMKEAEKHCRRHGFSGVRPLAKAIDKPFSSVSKAIAKSPYLKARQAEYDANRRGGRKVSLNRVIEESTPQTREADPSAGVPSVDDTIAQLRARATKKQRAAINTLDERGLRRLAEASAEERDEILALIEDDPDAGFNFPRSHCERSRR